MRRHLHLFVLPVLALGAACGGHPAVAAARRPGASVSPASGPDSVSGITAHGLGRVAGAPDLLTVTIGVEADDTTANGSLARANERVAAVVAALHQRGVAEADLQTSQVSLWPQYASPGANIKGYHSSHTLKARLHDLPGAGTTIDEAIHAAGDSGRLQGVNFSVEDQSAPKATARKEAVQRAHDQATQLAAAAGVHLGTLRSLTERSVDVGPLNMRSAMGSSGGAAAGAVASPVPLQPGSTELDVEVDAVYDLA